MSDHATHDYHDPAAPPRLCENCQTPLRGPYCSACGQHDFDVHRSFRHLFHEALESFFHFDGKFFSSVFDLLFHPGRLTVAFNAGKRVSQVPPLRFYVFVSLVFFVWLSFTRDAVNVIDIGGDAPAAQPGWTIPHAQDGAEDKAPEPTAPPAAKRQEDPATAAPTATAGPRKIESDGLDYENDQWIYRSKPGKDTTIGRFFADKLNHRHEIGEAFVHFMPKMLLFCLPLFALYTRVLFRKAGLVYLQHLVLALHLHTFAYLYWMFIDGWRRAADLITPDLGQILAIAAALYAIAYFYLSLKHVFGESALRTFVKSGFLFFSYWLTLGLAALVTIGLAVFLV